MNNRSFIFSITMSEIIIILFFLLALMSTFKINEKEKSITLLTNDIKIQEQKLIAQEEIIEKILQEDANLNENFDELVNVTVYKNKIASLENELKIKNKLLENIKNNDEIEKLINQYVNKQLKYEKLSNLTSQNKKMQQQIKFYKRKEGFGLPPCWIGPKGKAEYLFHITLYEDKIFVKEGYWTKKNRKRAKNMPNIDKLINKELKLDEFLDLSESIYKSSVKEQCRHFVILRDNVKSKKAFKNMTFNIENYFYKYHENIKSIVDDKK